MCFQVEYSICLSVGSVHNVTLKDYGTFLKFQTLVACKSHGQEEAV